MGDAERSVVMVGAGGHARVVADALLPKLPVGHLSRDEETDVEHVLGPKLGGDERLDDLAASGHSFALGVGFVNRAGAARRAEIIDAIEATGTADMLTVCHERAIVSPSATLGPGCYVGAGAIVGTGVSIAAGAIVNSGAVIDHDCRVGRNVHVAPGVVISGGVEIGSDTLIGVGATVLQNVRIGSRVVIGAGAVVLANVADDVTAVGVPARATT